MKDKDFEHLRLMLDFSQPSVGKPSAWVAVEARSV